MLLCHTQPYRERFPLNFRALHRMFAIRLRRELEVDLKQALDDGSLEVYYQPLSHLLKSLAHLAIWLILRFVVFH